MINNGIFLCEPFPKLSAERLWVEYYRGDGFSIGRVADWSLMVVLAGGVNEYDQDGEPVVITHFAWHIDKAYAEKIIDNNRIFLADLSSKSFDREQDLLISSKDGVQVLSAIRDEVANGTRQCLIDSELEELLKSYKTDKEKAKANREQNEARKNAIFTVEKPWYIRIIDNPFKRFLYGAVMVAIGGMIPILFLLCGFLCLPFFFWGEYQQIQWHETAQRHSCEHCGAEKGIRVLQFNYRMNIPFLRKFTSITYYKTYYAVCAGCTEKYIENDEDVGLLFNIAKAGSIYIKQLTKVEVEQMVRK